MVTFAYLVGFVVELMFYRHWIWTISLQYSFVPCEAIQLILSGVVDRGKNGGRVKILQGHLNVKS